MANEDDLGGFKDEAINGKTPPSQKFADWLHGQVSTKKATDLHHRLGFGHEDAAFGDHTHDGKDSKPLFDPADVTLTDITAAATGAQIATAVNALNAALRRLGAG